MSKQRLLDLFCCQGGAAMGYHRAGFEVVGVDIAPQPRYPFEFHQADALEYLAAHGHEFDAVHASPPCQDYTSLKSLHGKEYVRLIGPTRDLLKQIGKPWAIENVEGAKSEMINPLKLCGTMFGLNTLRHRMFEVDPPIYFPPAPCHHYKKVSKLGPRPDPNKFMTVAGHFSGAVEGGIALGIDWMTKAGLSQSIPPAYTQFIGKHLIAALEPA